MTLNSIYNLILKRKKEMPPKSYVADLFRAGNDRIIQKVGEESIEILIAAKNGNRKEIIAEMADLWFNTLILLATFNITIGEIENELEKRKRSNINKVDGKDDKIKT